MAGQVVDRLAGMECRSLLENLTLVNRRTLIRHRVIVQSSDCSVTKLGDIGEVCSEVPSFPALHLTHEGSLTLLRLDAPLDKHEHRPSFTSLVILLMSRRQARALRVPVALAQNKHQGVSSPDASKTRNLGRFGTGTEILCADRFVAKRCDRRRCSISKILVTTNRAS